MINCKKIGLVILTAFLFVSKVSAQTLKDAEAEFEKIQPNIDGFDGLAARIDALSVLTSESRALKMANLMIILLFIAVETAPIFVKIISPRGPYDELLDLAEKSIEVYSNEKTVKLVRESEERLKEGEVRFEV